MKKLFILIGFAWVAALGFGFGIWLTRPAARVVETAKMETCLGLYRDYRQDPDQEKLAASLKEISMDPRDFQFVIDRFIYYRSQKSATEQAMKLLKAFRMGYDIKTQVYSMSGYASDSFSLDAEILAVFESKPELIKKAFEG